MQAAMNSRPEVSARAAAQNEVAGFLSRSRAFNALPAERQAKIMADTEKVVGYIADAGGMQMLQHAVGPRAMARGMAGGSGAPRARAMVGPQGGNAEEPSHADYVSGAGQALADTVHAVDFPGFVADLIQGVFQAIVDASIQQMEAFAELVANVSKSVDQYMKDNISDDQARDYLSSQYPDHLEPDLNAGRLTPKRDADPDSAPNFLQDLGLPFELDDVDDEEMEKELVTTAKRKLAMDRQQMLATMVLMGLNRIVVTDGQIRASVVFDLDAKAMDEAKRERETSFEYNRNTDYTRRRTKKSDGFLGLGAKKTRTSKLNVKTDTKYKSDTTTSDERVRETELKAKLTGNVDLRFKSETFPPEKMVELMGMNEETVTRTAKQAPPGQQASAGAPGITPPPPPPLPAS